MTGSWNRPLSGRALYNDRGHGRELLTSASIKRCYARCPKALLLTLTAVPSYGIGRHHEGRVSVKA
jgi:hypothetical protein